MIATFLVASFVLRTEIEADRSRRIWAFALWLWKRLIISSVSDIFPAVFVINRLIALVTEICPFFQCYLNSKGIGKKYKDNLRWIWPSVDRQHGTNSSLTICSSFRVQILFLYERLGILGGDRLFFTFGTHLGRFLKILFRNELVSKLGIKSFIATSKTVKLFTIWFSYERYSLMFHYTSFFSCSWFFKGADDKDLNVSDILRSSFNITSF